MPEIVNCKQCGNVFQKTTREICPACIKEQKVTVEVVVRYVKTNPRATTIDVVKDTGVSLETMLDLIDDGLLLIRDIPTLSFVCARCGGPSTDGRYCTRCKNELTMELAAASDAVKHLVQSRSMKSPVGYYSKQR